MIKKVTFYLLLVFVFLSGLLLLKVQPGTTLISNSNHGEVIHFQMLDLPETPNKKSLGSDEKSPVPEQNSKQKKTLLEKRIEKSGPRGGSKENYVIKGKNKTQVIQGEIKERHTDTLRI